MLKKRLSFIFGLLIIASMVLAACGPVEAPAPVEEPVAPVEEPAAPVEEPAEPTEEPAEPEPTAVPPTTRKGGWLDQIVVSVVGADAVITQLEAGTIDVYSSALAAKDLAAIEAAGMKKSIEIGGTFYEMTYNPVGPEFPGTGKLNPFGVAKIREAMNWLVNRDYLIQEVYSGGGLAKFFPIVTQYPDYANMADVARALEAKYAFDPDKANEVITAEMEALGAELVDGKWNYNGEPVVLINLIRTDHDGTRVPVGDYVSSQLESIGFTVDRQYKTSSEASPLWVMGNPADGLWHLYTGAWGATVISRDMASNFRFYSSPSSAYGFSPLWQAYSCGEEHETLATALAFNDFQNLEEKRVAFARIMELELECSLRTWLVDGLGYAPYSPDVELTYDIAAGIGNGSLWPYTVRFTGQEGGELKLGQPDLFVDPWNPIAGSNWSFDGSVQRATNGAGVVADPHTGLFRPMRIERAEVVVETGLPVGITLDWVTLDFADEIVVPEDAWADWDAETETFVTVADKFPEGTTAQVKSVVYYPADLYDVKWHDGSSVSAADIVMNMIMTFAPGTEGSVIYDESQASSLTSFLSVFQGFKVVSTEPLVVEYYTNGFQTDAELNVTSLWPAYLYGEAPWHTLAIANLAEANGELAYSSDKADENEIEWTSFIGGPSLEILSTYLGQASDENFIPFAATLGEFVSEDEAAARYANLQAFYAAQGHFWVGTGPYYLDQVFTTEKTASLKHFADHADMADRWATYGDPKIAEVEVDGSGQVAAGTEAIFDVFVTFEGEAYPADEIKEVKFLLYDASGALVLIGDAAPVADGQYLVTIPAEETTKLESGASKIEIAVVPLPVAIPTFEDFSFVVVK